VVSSPNENFSYHSPLTNFRMIVKKLGRKIKTDDSQLTLKLFESGNEKDDKVKPSPATENPKHEIRNKFQIRMSERGLL